MSTSVPLQPYNKGRAYFGVELSKAASTFSGSVQLLGTVTINPVKLLIKNQTNQTVFFADNSGSTNGTTMVAGEEIILDCMDNKAVAQPYAFPIGTSFYVTAPVGTGTFKVSVLGAE